MSITKTFAGGTYNLPQNREPKGLWGVDLSNFILAVADNAIPRTGGANPLSAELNLGANYGVLAPYIKSASSNISTAGILRLANNEGVGFRNAANDADLLLKVNASNALEVDGVVVTTASNTQTITNKRLTSPKINEDVALTATATELNYVEGVSSSVQDQLDAKLLPDLSNVSGTLGISNGGTGQTGKTAAMDALSPTSTKGQILVDDGTNVVAMSPGTDGYALVAASGETAGLAYAAVATDSLAEQSIKVGDSGTAAAVDTSSVGDILADDTNGLTIKAGAIDDSGLFASGAVATSSSPGVSSRFVNWTEVSHSSGDYSGSGGATDWSVSSGNLASLKYTVHNNTMTVSFRFNDTDVDNTPSYLAFPIPGGFAVSGDHANPIYIEDDTSTGSIGWASARSTSGQEIRLLKASGNWTDTSSSGNTTIRGQITFEISS